MGSPVSCHCQVVPGLGVQIEGGVSAPATARVPTKGEAGASGTGVVACEGVLPVVQACSASSSDVRGSSLQGRFRFKTS
jgi:hypothetical protein